MAAGAVSHSHPGTSFEGKGGGDVLTEEFGAVAGAAGMGGMSRSRNGHVRNGRIFQWHDVKRFGLGSGKTAAKKKKYATSMMQKKIKDIRLVRSYLMSLSG